MNTLKLSKLFGILALALLLASMATTDGNVTAQPISAPASGCRESAVLTTEAFLNTGTGAFTQDRTLIPGEETTVVLGAWTFYDGAVIDPAGPSANCAGGAADGLPTYVTKIVVKPVSGDPVNAGVQSVTFWQDVNIDGFLVPGQDIQLSGPIPGTCLTSPAGCILTFGNVPIFGGFAGLVQGTPPPTAACVGTGICEAIILVAEIANPKPGATLQVRAEGFASDIVNAPAFGGSAFSSDFAPQFKKQTSNTRLVVQGAITGEPGVISPAVNNGSGNPETGVNALDVLGIRARDDRDPLARDARPSDREYFVGLANVCEGSEAIKTMVTILPVVASPTPQIAGGVASTPCILTAPLLVDTLSTNITRIRVGVSGSGAQWVQAVHVYMDTATGGGLPSNGTLFEPGELILSATPVNGVASIGSLEQTLTTSGGTAITLPAAPGGAVPTLFYFTVDIDDRATASDVRVQVAFDVADIIGTASSRLARTAPQEFKFKISGPPPTVPPTAVGLQITPSSGSTTKRSVRVTATITNPGAAPALAKVITATGCEVRKVQVKGVPGVRKLPVIVPAGGAVSVKVSLRCPKGGAVWTLNVVDPPVGAAATLQALDELTVAKRSDGFHFAALGAESLKLEVFDLTGRRIYDSGFVAGNALRWDMLKEDGNRLANGVYLYVVAVRDANGEIVRSEVKKLVIIR